MRFGKLGLLHFIILAWARTLFSPFDGVEAKDKIVYAVELNCVPGTFITNAGCQKCLNGTFSDKHNATKCSPCDRCSGKHNEMVEPCTRSTNTKCSCLPGYYYNDQLEFCLKCIPCKKGQGVVRNCTATSNTECDFCLKGQTFSNEKNLQSCKPCSRCAEGRVTQTQCTRRTDTVCVREKDKNNSKVPRIPKVSTGALLTRTPLRNRTTTTAKKKRLKSLTTRVSTEPISAQNQSTTAPNQKEHMGREDDTELTVTLCSLIAVLIVFIVVFALACYYKKRRNRPRKKPKPGGEEPSTRSNSTDVIEAVENPYSSLPFISKPGQEKMLRDVPYTLISDLSFHLNPGERWKQLGGQLKFNSTQINTFALVKANATQAMLEEWGQKDGATVVALQRIFRKLKWGKEERMVGKYV